MPEDIAGGSWPIDLRGGADVVLDAAARIAATLVDDQPVVVDLSNYAREGHWIAVSVESTTN